MLVSSPQSHLDGVDPIILRILLVLRDGLPLSERQLSQRVNCPRKKVLRALRRMYDLNLIFPRQVGRATVWVLNEGCYLYRHMLELALRMSEIPPVRKHLMTRLKEVLKSSAFKEAYLYGSAAGVSDEKAETNSSDIDIAIIMTQGSENDSCIEASLNAVSAVCVHEIGKKDHQLVLTEREWEKLKKKPIGQAILKGERIIP